MKPPLEKQQFTELYETSSWLNTRDDVENSKTTKAWHSWGRRDFFLHFLFQMVMAYNSFFLGGSQSFIKPLSGYRKGALAIEGTKQVVDLFSKSAYVTKHNLRPFHVLLTITLPKLHQTKATHPFADKLGS